jgi:hypothetical protein
MDMTFGHSEGPGLLTDRREDDGPFSVWDGDDMTLEMMTDLNDGEVDEEVAMIFFIICLS